MPALSDARHERFCQEVAKGSTQIEAYAVAGYARNESHACRLAARPEIAARIAELLEVAAERAVVTIEDLVKELEDARLKALGAATPQSAAAVAATLGKAKLLGLVTDKHELTGKGGGPIETRDLTRLSDDELQRLASEG